MVHNVYKLGIYYGADSILGFGAHFRVGVQGREREEEEEEGAMGCDDARSAIESPQFRLQSMRFLPWRFFLRNFSNRRPPFSLPPFTSGESLIRSLKP